MTKPTMIYSMTLPALLAMTGCLSGPANEASASEVRTESQAQVERDVPYVPTPEAVVEAMLKMANVGKNDMVWDLGCGDGRIVVMAAQKYGARGAGVDIDPQRIRESNENARAAGVTERVRFMTQDLFKIDFSDATVVTLYLLPTINERLMPTLLNLRPGTRIVSHDFLIGDWEPDQSKKVEDRRIHHLYFWVVPAKVHGDWTLRPAGGQEAEINLRQERQKVTGTLKVGNRTVELEEAKLEGAKFTCVVAMPVGSRTERVRIEGTVDGNTMTGSMRDVRTDGGMRSFRATRRD
jgi:SAM-dependent methyltransferase